jgi:putative ABC transport system permease protein
MSGRSRTVRVAAHLHRALLRLVPSDVRMTYGADMMATFEAAADEARASSRLAVLRLLLHELVDLARSWRANRPAGVPGAAAPQPVRGSLGEGGPRGDWIQLWAWRQAWRALARRPAFLAATVSTLALGAGVTTAVFSLVDTVLIKPLPYPDADALATVYELSPSARERRSLVAPGRLQDWNRLNRSFVAISAIHTETFTDTSGQEPERLAGVRVAPRFFEVYGQQPLAGRWFVDDEERETGANAVVISERFWTRRFNRDPSALGRALVIGGKGHPIVGVMPASFSAAATDVWLPAKTNAWLLGQRDARFLQGVGRLRAGVTLEQAARDLALVQEALARQFPKTDSGWSAEVRSLKEARIDSSRRGLVLLFASVGALWLIAVANIAGLTLVQVRRRGRELAVRAALGASRGRAIAFVWREGLIIGAVAAVLGSAIAVALVQAIPGLLTATPRMNELTLDWRALSFTVVTTLLATIIVSVIPAVVGTRRDLHQMMATGSRGVAGGRHRFQQGLVLAQVALSVTLVGSATLLLRSYYNLTIVDRGFDPNGVTTFHVAAGWSEDRHHVGLLQTRLLSALRDLPHVQAAGLTNFLPAPGGSLRYSVRVAGLTGPNADGSMTVGSRTVTEGYLRAIRAPLVAGSSCPSFRMNDQSRAVMVNQRFVDMYAPNQNLVGRALEMVQSGASATYTIIGVVGTMSEDGPAVSPVPFYYVCSSPGWWPDPEYVVRTADARALARDLRQIVNGIDSKRAIFGLRPLRDVVDGAFDQPRLDAGILAAFASAALALAGIGLYSLFMLVVSDRTREIAVRLAIGASPGEMIRLIALSAARLLLAGLVLGIVLTAAAGRVLRGVLFGVTSFDAGALAASAAVIAMVAMAAVAAPAIRAARVAPTDALRGD